MEVYIDDSGYAHDDEGNTWYVGKGLVSGTLTGRQARKVVRVTAPSSAASSIVVRTFESSSSPGKVYTVRRTAGRLSCDCPGFRNRKTCKHAGEVKG